MNIEQFRDQIACIISHYVFFLIIITIVSKDHIRIRLKNKYLNNHLRNDQGNYFINH